MRAAARKALAKANTFPDCACLTARGTASLAKHSGRCSGDVGSLPPRPLSRKQRWFLSVGFWQIPRVQHYLRLLQNLFGSGPIECLQARASETFLRGSIYVSTRIGAFKMVLRFLRPSLLGPRKARTFTLVAVVHWLLSNIAREPRVKTYRTYRLPLRKTTTIVSAKCGSQKPQAWPRLQAQLCHGRLPLRIPRIPRLLPVEASFRTWTGLCTSHEPLAFHLEPVDGLILLIRSYESYVPSNCKRSCATPCQQGRRTFFLAEGPMSHGAAPRRS